MINIFEPKTSVIADGLEGKIILLYGSNNLGKTAQAVRFNKPFVAACENGLNGISGVNYEVINRWSDFKSMVTQFTSDSTIKKAREMYSTIVIDEVYAASIYCQDYVCKTYGDGALTLADGDSKHNLYQLYEKEFFRQINLLANSGFTIVFIAHQQENTKTGFISPKGDKRCMNPIVDRCDYVVYLKSNGVDNEGKVIKSSAYLAETNEFFARARIEYTPTIIREFTAENLIAAIQEGINKKQELENATVVSFNQQKQLNTVEELNFVDLVTEFNSIVNELAQKDREKFDSYWTKKITEITERYLDKGAKVNQCNANQAEAVSLIVADLKEVIASN